MNLESFSSEQVDGLLELLVLGMYVDGHLADVEDQTIKEFAREAGLRQGYSTERAIDRAITAVRQVPRDEAGLRAAVERIARVMNEEDVRVAGMEALAAIHSSDANDSPSEIQFHQIVQDVFDL